MDSSLFVLVNVTMRTSWHPRPALDTIGAEYVRDVLPGETVTITLRMALYQICQELCLRKRKPDVSLNIFILQDPDSHIDGISVYASRIKAGRFLAMDSPVDADLVVGVPESR